MAVDSRQHPENDLAFDESAFVLRSADAAVEHAENVSHSGPAIRFVFFRGRQTESLAKIFLRQTGDPSALQGPVKSRDRENFSTAELQNFASGGINTVALQEA